MEAVYPEFAGRVALITGAAMGIGKETARRMAALGSRVLLADIAADAVEAAASEIRAEDHSAQAIVLDVCDAVAVQGAIDTAVDEHGALHILVCCAGGVRKIATIESVSPEEWRAMVELNLSSVFYCCRAVVPHMKKQGWGRIVTLSSSAGRTVLVPTAPHYAAAKAGVIRLTQHLARELGPYNVTVNALAPGTTETERVKQLRTQEQKAEQLRLTPVGRFGTVADQANAILFLCSDGASYITGATLDVNGGKVMI